MYAFNGAPSGTPVNPDAVGYDYATGSIYYWDPVAAVWEPSAGNMLDWHVTGNSGTAPLSAAGTDFVGTSDDVALDIATDGTSRVTVGDTATDAGAVTVHPDGTNDRVTITDAATSITHVDGTTTERGYVGDDLSVQARTVRAMYSRPLRISPGPRCARTAPAFWALLSLLTTISLRQPA